MARGTPIYDSGTIPAGGGTQAAFIAKIVEKLTEYQSNGVDAWELVDQLDVGADYEAVFHSVGDRTLGAGANAGDTDLFVKLHRKLVDDYELRVYQDWSPTSHTGYREAGVSNLLAGLSDVVQIDWFSVCNEYEFVFIWVYGGLWKGIAFGALIRPVSDALGGVARTISQSGVGNGIIFGLDRDISADIEVGQYVWLVNQTPNGIGLQSVAIDLCLVTAVGVNSITVDGVVNTYANGSVVGYDPLSTYCIDGGNLAGTFYFSNAANGAYTAANGQTGQIINPGSYLTTESDMDPGPDQLYRGFQPCIRMFSPVPKAFRGKFQHFRLFTLGAQADKDLMEVDFDASQRWKAFISANAILANSWVTAIGPGAN